MWKTKGHKRLRGKPPCSGTCIVGDSVILTGNMVEQALYGLTLVLGCLVLFVCPADAADMPDDTGNMHRIDMHHRLQLRNEQEEYRQSVEPLSPEDRRNLELQLNQQRLQQRNLQFRQDQRLQAERHKRSIDQWIDPYRINRPGPGLQRQEQQQQQQRLQMRMQRNTWPYSRNKH